MTSLLGLLPTLFFLSSSPIPNDSLTAELTAFQAQSSIPGFAVAIVTEEGVQYQHAFGMADKEAGVPFSTSSLLNIGSVSKTLVGVAVIKAIDNGVLTLDTPINGVLPFEVVNPYFDDTPITVRHLITHRSSIPDTPFYGRSYVLEEPAVEGQNIHEGFYNFAGSHEPMALEAFLKRILTPKEPWYKKKNYLKHEPGTSAAYSNLNAALAALVVEQATGQSFVDFVQTSILDPLNMTDSGWRIQDIDLDQHAVRYFPDGTRVPRYRLITYPDGGFISSVENLSHYLLDMIRGFSGDGQVLSAAGYNMLLPGDGDEDRAFFGMGEVSRNIGHAGSDPGVQADLQFNADSKVGRIILANVNAEDSEALWEEYREIHDILKKYEVSF